MVFLCVFVCFCFIGKGNSPRFGNLDTRLSSRKFSFVSLDASVNIIGFQFLQVKDKEVGLFFFLPKKRRYYSCLFFLSASFSICCSSDMSGQICQVRGTGEEWIYPFHGHLFLWLNKEGASTVLLAERYWGGQT